ncbi:MAG: glycosyltransferase family 2 protein [bacterium]|nr:glycosyltransferase family 2 protein [bacterium]
MKLIVDVFFYLLSLAGLLKVIQFYRKKSLPKLQKTSISIIIPVRNEERRLPRLLESIKNQTKRPLEVIVVNDGSEDNTHRIALSYDVKLIHAQLIPGWTGKSYACYIGAREAKGDVMLFLDADVVLKEDFLEKIGGKISDTTVFSIQPYHKVVKFYEHFSLFFNLVSLLGILGKQLDSSAHFAYGLFGPCIFFPKKLYEETGGHSLVKDSIVEDLDLGVELQKRGIQVLTLPHNRLVSYRMYEYGIKSLVFGWVKNFSEGAAKAPFISILQVVGIVATSFMLTFMLKGKVFLEGWTLISYLFLFAYLTYLFFVFLALKEIGSANLLDIILWPLHSLFFTFVFVLSLILKIAGVKVLWKGRKGG